MTAQTLAILIQAKRSGTGWSAKCPAHPDRSPSLSIHEGDDGRILLKCFAGCSIDSILAALNLRRRDLFAGPPPNRDQLAAILLTQETRAQAARIERKARFVAIQRAQRMQSVVNALGGKLARHPDDRQMVLAFHLACDLLRRAETTVDLIYERMRRDSAQERKVG